MLYLVDTGDIALDESNGDFMEDSGGVRRGVGEGEIRENESRRGGRCIIFATGFFANVSYLYS